MMHKYIKPPSLEDWIRIIRKTTRRGSIIWKAMIGANPTIENNLASLIGNEEKVRICTDS